MRHTDVVIAGGGLAGSLAAAMLGRAGIDAVLVDPHPVYPPDFRCEKLDGEQLQTLKLTGLADAVMRASTPDQECWVARFGRLVEKLPGDQRGILYDTLVNTVRSQIPNHTEFIHAKVTDIATGPERQTVKLSTGEEIAARLVVLATGLNIGLRQKLGIDREIISPGHSISIGFDIQPVDRLAFPFSSLTYFTERAADRMAYITLFPIGGNDARQHVRLPRSARSMAEAVSRRSRSEHSIALWPGLHEMIGDFTVTGFVQIRPVDLYVTKGYRQNGVVLVGDAFSSSCPAAGTGARKVWSTSSGSAMSTSRAGSRPRAWAKPRSPRFTTTGQAGLRHAERQESISASFLFDRHCAALDRTALRQVHRALGSRPAAAPQRRPRLPPAAVANEAQQQTSPGREATPVHK